MSSGVMAAAAVAIRHTMDGVVPGTHLASQAIRLGATIGGRLAALAITVNILRVEALGDAVEMARSRVRTLLSK